MISKKHTDKLTAKLPEIETKLSDPNVAKNQKMLRDLSREYSALKKLKDKSDKYFKLEIDVQEHRELIKNPESDRELADLATHEIDKLEKELATAHKELMISLLPPDPNERRNAIMEIRAGTGGSEAALFAGDLFRMYNRYAESKSWKIGMIDASSSDVGGYKDIVFSIEGENVYANLQYESGVHRVQRVPTTESSGRIHTSTATVAVFPEAEPEDDIEINPNELRIDVFCSSGPGGQSVNTTYSAVRITHLPSGLSAQSQDERSQSRNKEKALSVLKARILDMKRHAEEEKMGKERRSQIGSGDRSEKIRTYNFPQNRLTDHRINLTLYVLNKIIDGDLNEVIEALKIHHTEVRTKKELGDITEN